PRAPSPVLSCVSRPPLSSTRFPYTTLFRSLAARRVELVADAAHRVAVRRAGHGRHRFPRVGRGIVRIDRAERRIELARDPFAARSEEHTSELQSPDHLVCRLLLEKKNKKTN